jgi:hypothetical protein
LLRFTVALLRLLRLLRLLLHRRPLLSSQIARDISGG